MNTNTIDSENTRGTSGQLLETGTSSSDATPMGSGNAEHARLPSLCREVITERNSYESSEHHEAHPVSSRAAIAIAPKLELPDSRFGNNERGAQFVMGAQQVLNLRHRNRVAR
jgi:hypothetical protein